MMWPYCLISNQTAHQHCHIHLCTLYDSSGFRWTQFVNGTRFCYPPNKNRDCSFMSGKLYCHISSTEHIRKHYFFLWRQSNPDSFAQRSAGVSVTKRIKIGLDPVLDNLLCLTLCEQPTGWPDEVPSNLNDFVIISVLFFVWFQREKAKYFSPTLKLCQFPFWNWCLLPKLHETSKSFPLLFKNTVMLCVMS